MRADCIVRIALLFGVTATAVASPDQKPQGSRQPQIVETDSETLWTGRFAHCDYGFFVLLPTGFVAHGSKPPSPNHGFLVGLPDPGLRHEITFSDERYMRVLAEYNSLDLKSLKDAADYNISRAKEVHGGFQVLSRQSGLLNGIAAVRVRFTYEDNGRKVIDESIVAMRAGIVYELGLQTTPANYAEDKPIFDKLTAGFRFWKIHYCS